MSRKGTAKTSFSAKKSESNAYLTPERAGRESNRGKVPFVIIIGLALYNAKIPLSVFEVFRFAKFYFPLCVTSASWKSTVRRHLKTKSLFKKVETLHGHLWSIDERNIGILNDNIATFTGRNRKKSEYGMKSPDLWNKLVEGTMGPLDQRIQVDLNHSDAISRPFKK